jgi:hypothetical protein
MLTVLDLGRCLKAAPQQNTLHVSSPGRRFNHEIVFAGLCQVILLQCHAFIIDNKLLIWGPTNAFERGKPKFTCISADDTGTSEAKGTVSVGTAHTLCMILASYVLIINFIIGAIFL